MKKNIEYLMGKECAEGNIEPISPEYISRMFNVPLKDAAFGTYLYDDYMSTLKKHAKKLDCPIEELHAHVDESVYDIEL